MEDFIDHRLVPDYNAPGGVSKCQCQNSFNFHNTRYLLVDNLISSRNTKNWETGALKCKKKIEDLAIR